MALAAHPITFSVSADDSSYSEVDGINSASFEELRDVLETTDFMDTSGARTRILGLLDVPIECSGDYESADTGQALIRTSLGSGATIYCRFLWNGSAGHKVACKAKSFKIDGERDGKVQFSASFVSTGAPSTV